jgi:hypothetical protein
MVTVDRLQNGTKVDMSTDATTGDTWYNWLTYISTLNISGYEDWLPITNTITSPWARQCNFGETLYRNFFVNPERALDQRMHFITGESERATIAFYFVEYGNLTVLDASNAVSNKSGIAGFVGTITKFIAIRMLTAADIAALTA